jgi:hypothetical protein
VTFTDNEPALTAGTVTAGATVILALVAAFGFSFTTEQREGILALVAFVAPFVVAALVRPHVTPTVKVDDKVDEQVAEVIAKTVAPPPTPPIAPVPPAS